MTKNDDSTLVPIEQISSTILLVRGQRVLLDNELAALYGVTTKRFNEQVKRNLGTISSRFYVPTQRRGGRWFEVAFCDLKARPRRTPLCSIRLHRAWRNHGCHHPQQLTRR